MKTKIAIPRTTFNYGSLAMGLFIAFMLVSCKDSLLDETPLSQLSAEDVLVSPSGFESYLIGLHEAARAELSREDNTYFSVNFTGTDVASDAGLEYVGNRNYISWLTPRSSLASSVWDWAYGQMILRANTIIVYANKEGLAGIWESEAERNAVVAEARFFRGYTYNLLANLYGGVPLVDTIYASPKLDYTRATREQTLDFARQDLEFASEWLPPTVDASREGRIVKAAADHLLAEVYISLGDYEKAVDRASAVIGSGLYHLMTERFGSQKDMPGDPFSDLFADGNQNRSSGNMESIYVWQYESNLLGGAGAVNGNQYIRNCGPFLTKIADPAGFTIQAVDSLGRGVGRVRGSNYMLYDVWRDDWDTDIRNSVYNMRRVFYYNNTASPHFGEVVEPRTGADDTLRNIYPYPRKVEGKPFNNNSTSGRISKDVMVFRLAETYLLRAEAYFRMGDNENAANDINEVRNRANAQPLMAAQVSEDAILDERARELFLEESRRRTLARMGRLVDRVRNYNLIEETRNTVQDYHEFFPIPQSAIDANIGALLEQNTGYH